MVSQHCACPSCRVTGIDLPLAANRARDAAVVNHIGNRVGDTESSCKYQRQLNDGMLAF